MTEPSTELTAVHTAITELAAIVAGARASLGGDSIGAGNQLEMAEMDLLSARDAIEKACWETDLASPTSADVRWPARSASPVSSRSAASTGSLVSADAEQPSPRKVRQPGRRAPGQGQGELFPIPAAAADGRRLAWVSA